MKSKFKRKISPLAIIMFVLLLVYSLSLIGLIFWGLLTSFKSTAEFRLNILGLPKEWVWNYDLVYRYFYVPVATKTGTVRVGMADMYINSILYAGGCAFFNTLVPCITAYACAKFPNKFSSLIYSIVIVTMVLPIVGSDPAALSMARFFGLYNEIWGLWIMKANFLGLYFLIFYNTFKAFPNAYMEAAKIDGAKNFTIMTRIMLPLVRTTFFTVMIILFIGFWNEYQVPLLYMPAKPTVAIGMFHMRSTTINGMSKVPMRMAGSMMMLIPILLLFVFTNKMLLGNLTMGGIKE